MSSQDVIQVEGIVVDVLPNTIFRVALPNGHRVLAHLAGKTRLNFVRIEVGDKVALEMSPYDLSKGSIILKEK